MTDSDELILGESTLIAEVLAEPGGEALSRCMACGTCSAGCPVREVVPEFDPRALVRLVALGADDAVFDGDILWLCSGCNTCDERCPQGVHLPSLIRAIRNVGVRRGHVPKVMMMQLDLLRQHGRLLEVEEHNSRRAKLGLPPMKNSGDDYRRLLELAGFESSVEAEREGEEEER